MDEFAEAERDVFWQGTDIIAVNFDRNVAVFEFEAAGKADPEFFQGLFVGQAVEIDDLGFSGLFDEMLHGEGRSGQIKFALYALIVLFGNDIGFVDFKDLLEGFFGLRELFKLNISHSKSVEGVSFFRML